MREALFYQPADNQPKVADNQTVRYEVADANKSKGEIQHSDVRCNLCSHHCVIHNQKTGRCRARRNIDGKLYAESYGCISALALDPIEKKPLHRFYPGRYILSVGSYGCNLSCPFCQNSSIAHGKPQTRFISPEKLVELAKQDPDNLGVAFTYNEPIVSIEYILDTAPLLKEAGLKVVLVTNGLVNPEPLALLLPHVDAMNIDVKSFTETGYQKLDGDVKTVKATVETCAKACHVEVTSLIVPGENDTPEEIKALSEWLVSISVDIPLHISRFFPRYKKTDKAPTSVSKLKELAKTAESILNYVYIGNV